MGKTFWISITLGSMLSTITYVWYMRRKSRMNIPVRWKQIGEVEKIIMYPLKAGALKLLTEASCTETGLVELANENDFVFHDRCFVIYDGKMRPLKLVACNQAVKISIASVDRDTVSLSAPNMDNFNLRLSDFLPTPKKVTLSYYASKLEVIDCGDEVSEWISQYLPNTYRLGYFLENHCHRRGVEEIMKAISPKLLSVYKARNNDTGLLSSIASYMIISAETVNDVNAQLSVEDQFDVGNLRPNIVVKGCEKYAEDDWNWIKIGENIIMKIFKPCTRCLMITINPYNGAANKNFQPFKLLKTYRTVKQLKGYDVEGDSPILGAYAGLYVPGKIKLGDPVYIDV